MSVEADERAGEMDEGEEVGSLLFPAYEKSAGAVHPAVRTLDNPSTRFPAVGSLRDVFPAAAQVQFITVELGQIDSDGIVVSLVQAQAMVTRTVCGTRPLCIGESFIEQLVIIAVGACHDDGERDPGRVGGQTDLGSALAPVGGIGAGFFPRPRAPWSCIHRH